MAIPLPSIGSTAKALGNSALPIGLSFRGLSKGSGFASHVGQKLQDLGDAGDILTQLAGLLQAGTPMATIIDKVSSELSKAIAKASGKGGDVDAQRTLQRALANALAPPGTSPPGDYKTQVATLVQQVNDILKRLTSELNTAGQKSEFSGQVLDAEKARELPAQQTKSTTTGTTMPAAMSSFVNSLLQRVTAQLQQPVPSTTQSQPVSNTPPLPDPLSRILARAVNANVQRGGEPLAKVATQPSNATASSSALFQRLIAIVAERSATQGDGSGKDAQDRSLRQSGLSVSPAQSQPNVPAPSGFAAQVTSAPVTTVHSTAAPAPYTAIDPQSVIEQVVKGIVIRNSGGTSEVRMRLQPEQLGDVSLKLTVSGNTITANIVAQNAHVRDMLLANQQQLARSLSEAGLSLGNFSVNVSGGNAGFTDQRSQQQQPKLARAGAFAAVLNGEDDTWADSRFGPPIHSASNALVLNYLA
jgi:flagellar hook-length control protein FliK